MLTKITSTFRELYQNRKLLMTLAKNDFKTKYAGSYLGIIWAFVQPIITILVYWFVFGNIFQTGSDRGAPYVLWLITGLVPWFFVQEGIVSGMNAFIEYNYLVKKVVFKISILPLVKVISAFAVNLFFIFFVLILYLAYGFVPDFYFLQIAYYAFCLFTLVVAVSYITSSIVVFFRDLNQIVNIVLQIGVWMTPIMWSFSDLNIDPNGKIATLLKLNPVYYIVNGYRTSLIDKIGFWEFPALSLYFWVVTLALLIIGLLLFKKLKIHFADVL
ncbi:ABC transporter permease [Enterococcus pingfangensis]|uniref:ABC transporter permease n=1 Tax=Enterococcus pingfangensis TaxID=2559924 RepID=UPI0010F9BBE0|nr:ABC transporter permease [Enterococcus pingfangensis]